jgi:hypothetical protein
VGIWDKAKAFARVGATKAKDKAGHQATDAAAKGAEGLNRGADKLKENTDREGSGADGDTGTTR